MGYGANTIGMGMDVWINGNRCMGGLSIIKAGEWMKGNNKYLLIGFKDGNGCMEMT